MVLAIIGLATAVAGGAFSLAGQDKQQQMLEWAKVPDWLSPADFYEKDNTLNYVMIGMALLALGLVVAIVLKK
jgi:hypothetical protein